MSVLLSVLNWIVLANEIPAIGVIAKSLATAAGTIFELLTIIMILLMILGSLLSATIGDKMQKWSGMGAVFTSVWRHFFVGVCLHTCCAFP